MNYNLIIAAIYDIAREYNIRNFINPLWIEITGEDADSVEYIVHHAPLTAKGWFMLKASEHKPSQLEIWKWDGYQIIGCLDTETMAITFLNPYAEDENNS